MRPSYLCKRSSFSDKTVSAHTIFLLRLRWVHMYGIKVCALNFDDVDAVTAYGVTMVDCHPVLMPTSSPNGVVSIQRCHRSSVGPSQLYNGYSFSFCKESLHVEMGALVAGTMHWVAAAVAVVFAAAAAAMPISCVCWSFYHLCLLVSARWCFRKLISCYIISLPVCLSFFAKDFQIRYDCLRRSKEYTW